MYTTIENLPAYLLVFRKIAVILPQTRDGMNKLMIKLKELKYESINDPRSYYDTIRSHKREYMGYINHNKKNISGWFLDKQAFLEKNIPIFSIIYK